MRKTIAGLMVMFLSAGLLTAPVSASPVMMCCELWVVNSDGAGERRLNTYGGGSTPQWSPVTDLILTSGGDISVLDPDSGETQALTNTQDVYERSATWSPDGGQIAFT